MILFPGMSMKIEDPRLKPIKVLVSEQYTKYKLNISIAQTLNPRYWGGSGNFQTTLKIKKNI